MNTNAIEFIVRPAEGSSWRGILDEVQGLNLEAQPSASVSLNLHPTDVARMDRVDDDLVLTLADGRIVVLEGYFNADIEGSTRLYLSADGAINEVSFAAVGVGPIFPNYTPIDSLGKWSPVEDLVFEDDPVVGYSGEVSMSSGGLLGAIGWGAAELGAAGLGGLGVISSLQGGNGEGAARVLPTVDDPDAVHRVGSNDLAELAVSGTAAPASTVEVFIGDKTEEVIVGDDGDWRVVFEGPSFPVDGDYPDVRVVVTEEDGRVTELRGSSFLVDTTPPDLTVEDGAVSTASVFNADAHENGVRISGTSEAGATVEITVGSLTQVTTASDDGSWSFSFEEGVFPTGEYTQDVTITATDDFDNTTVLTDGIRIDTENSVTLTSVPLTADNTINAVEHADKVVFSGTTDPDATVTLAVAGVSGDTIAHADGTWSIEFSGGTLPHGAGQTFSASVVSVDPAGNVSETTHQFVIDLEAEITMDTSSIAGDGMVNGFETEGVTVIGTAEAAATVVVTVTGNELPPVTADADGAWSVVLPENTVSEGEAVVDISAVATDIAGNTASTAGNFVVDTFTYVTISTETVADDGTINAAERAEAPVALTGTAQPGATVAVTVGTTQLEPVTAQANGTWAVSLPQSLIPTGETSLPVSATATDPAGNTAQTSGSIAIDTELAVTVETDNVTDDGTINGDERADGVPLSGISEPGAVVQVFVGKSAAPLAPVIADDDGNWSVQIPTSLIPEGHTGLAVRAEATDAAGNTASATGTIAVDTLVDTLTMSRVETEDGPVSSGAPLNLAESQAGVVLTGEVETGSTVSVTVEDTAFEAAVTDTTWMLDVPADLLEGRSGTMAVSVQATDPAMNTREISGSIAVDTTPPEAPVWVDYTRGHDGLSSITLDSVPDLVGISQLVSDPGGVTVSELAASSIIDLPDVGTFFRFAEPVADGSHLVASYTDDAGNVSGTLLVTDDPASNSVFFTEQMAQAVGEFEIKVIDLQFAEDTSLTITEEQLLALSGTTDTLAVFGGNDDSVTIAGANRQGATEMDGRTMEVYSLGDASILIEDSIHNVNTAVF